MKRNKKQEKKPEDDGISDKRDIVQVVRVLSLGCSMSDGLPQQLNRVGVSHSKPEFLRRTRGEMSVYTVLSIGHT